MSSDDASRVRTRFAPSPTGSLHVGNARTAVINWLVARHHGGDFILRIEDTDTARNIEGAEARLMADLQWLGLDWDEGPDPETGEERGERGPYHQSRRQEIYQQYAHRLLESGGAYRCYCTAETLATERERAVREGRSPGYTGTCRRIGVAEGERRAASGEPHVLRLATPGGGAVVVDDAIRGRVSFDAATLGDFVLVRSDGVPTYNFAVVVDDAEMAITHVVRGAGHLSNTPNQILLYRALGLEPPIFAHTPTVLGEDRSKLSKRSGARPLQSLAEEGLHPEAVVNYLSLLGWSSRSEEEVLTRERLIDEVTLDRMNAGDVVFDPEKMRWLSGQHIARMSLEDLGRAVRPHLEGTRFEPLLDDRLPTVLGAVRSHLTAFSEITDHLAPFLGPSGGGGGSSIPGGGSSPVDLGEEDRRVVEAVRDRLKEVETWDEAAIMAAVKKAGAAVGARGRSLYAPLRPALTGEEHGPPLAAIVWVQGREAALRHLDRALRDPASDV